MSGKSRLLAAVAALALLLGSIFVAGCGSSDSSSSSSGSTSASADLGLISNGTLTVGSDIPYPPFEFGKGPDYQGFDIDLINAIADNIGVDTKIEDTAFDTIFTDLAQNKFDVVASASTITPERQATVNFSDPYYEAQQALLVQPGSDIKTVDDLAGKTIGVQNGTTGKIYAEDEVKDAGSIRGFPTGPDVIAALRGTQLDAAIIDQPVAQDAIDKGQTGFEIATTIPTNELYGIAIGKDNKGLLDAVNGALTEMKKNGQLNEIYQKWFKIDASKGVIDGTTTNP